MKKISSGIAVCMLFAMVLFTSCAKDGPAGATGATGATGAAGPAGPAGVAGPAGATGTANVIYSAWLDQTYSIDSIYTTVTPTGIVKDTTYFTVISAPKLTSAILSQGEIKVYWNLGTAASPTVVPIPYFDGGILINPYYYLNSTGAGSIELDANFNLSTRTVAAGKIFQYRYILIPGGTVARSVINWKDYKAVQAYLGLKD